MKRLVFISLSFCCSVLWAGPAAWYKWRSVDSEADVCSQVPPGDAWVMVKGPFQDALCRKQGIP